MMKDSYSTSSVEKKRVKPEEEARLKQIEAAQGKIKKFIKKKIKFRRFPHKRGVNVYVVDTSTGKQLISSNEAMKDEGDDYLSYSSSDDHDNRNA